MPRKPTDDGRPRRPFKPRDGKPPRRGGAAPARPPRETRAWSRSKPPERAGKPAPDVAATLPAPAAKERERVAKVVARAGLGSRREVEEWIAAGRVAVNGETLTTPAFTVTAADRITVDGAPLAARERTRLFLFHKPRGLVTTTDDPEGRPTVFDVLPKGLPRLVSVGRLDVNTEGLLLLTNDGGLARVLELPETGWLRRYRVRAFGDITQAQLDALREGVEVDGFRYGPIEATLDRTQGSNVWLTVALREGKKREIRTVLGHLGVQVNRLIRVSFGPFQLGELAEGTLEEIKTRVLRDQLGERIAAAAGADFDAPLREPEPEPKPEPPRERAPRDAVPARDGRRPPRRERTDRERPNRERPNRERPEREERRPPAPRGRRKANIWRAPPDGDAPLKRKPRRGREAAPARDERPTRTGLLSDRKGRRVLVERIAASEPAPEEPRRERGARAGKPAGGPPGKHPGKRPGGKPFGGKPFAGKRPPGKPFGKRPGGGRPGDRPRGPRRPRG